MAAWAVIPRLILWAWQAFRVYYYYNKYFANENIMLNNEAHRLYYSTYEEYIGVEKSYGR